jgi:glyoxylate reductase
MEKNIFVIRRISDDAIDSLRSQGYRVDIGPWEYPPEQSEIIEYLRKKDYLVLVTLLTDKIDEFIFDACPTVKLIINFATGYDNIDVVEATKRGIVIANCPAKATIESVAEHTVALVLALLKNIPKAHDFTKSGSYIGWSPFNFMSSNLAGKSVGLIGAGRIGTRTAQLLRNLGATILYHDMTRNALLETGSQAEYVVSLDELFRRSDFVSLHTPLTEATRHIINSTTIKLMKSSAFLINTGRGPLVDEDALVEAIEGGLIAGAALDVFEHEPYIGERLRCAGTVILTPHIASATIEARAEMADMVVENITTYYGKGRASYSVNAYTGRLIIVRHQESEWNKIGVWTGMRDRRLSEKGFENAEKIGILIKDLRIDQAFASMLVRSIETLSCMLNTCEKYSVPTRHIQELNERDYGDYNGKNKYEVEAEIGEAEYNSLRRGWDHPVPNGETLKKVYERVVPFYFGDVLPLIKQGKNVLIVAHGNSLRALTKYIESVSDMDIEDVEIDFNKIIIYNLDEQGRMIDKEIRELEGE